MNQEKIGKFIKELRRKNNLTQKELADKYNVTYQAVSKWENGKNIPDLSLIRKMSKDFNIDIEDILDGKIKNKKNSGIIKIIIIVLSILILCGIFVIIFNKNKSFNFKTITTTCNDFNVTGSIAYDNDKTSIYISNIDYCGNIDNTIYKTIECNLYEKNNNMNVVISNCKKEKNISLDNYLKDIKLNADNYLRVCKNYDDDSLFLEINATDNDNKITTYKIPLKLNSNCE